MGGGKADRHADRRRSGREAVRVVERLGVLGSGRERGRVGGWGVARERERPGET